MNIVICGGGQVGTHAAEVLGEAHHEITVIDRDAARLDAIADSMDVGTYTGNAAQAEVLREAGAAEADLVLAATDVDEVNLLTATIAKGLGARRVVARVHHGTYFEKRGFDYERQLGIDSLICPEYSTALAIAASLRNPGAMAVETFARGSIQMQQFSVSEKSPAIGKKLKDLDIPAHTRVAAISRQQEAFIPEAATELQKGDIVVLVGNTASFQDARKLLQDSKVGRRKVILMGGTPMAVWLCRALHDRNFAIRLFETGRERAEELADKLSWVTVMQANPTDRDVAQEEHLGQADVFVALREQDEDNIIASVLAKSMGVTMVIAVVQNAAYLDLIYHIGVDRALNPSQVAVKEVQLLLDERPLQPLESLADGAVDAYRVRVGEKGDAIGKPLRQVPLSPNWIVAAVRRGEKAWVPGADDTLEPGDTALVVGRHGMEKQLKLLFTAG
jgi:trk system potassium uptake protein TrkA